MGIAFGRSTDDGVTWTAPVRLNDVTTNDQFLPRIATMLLPGEPPSSMMRVIWYDRRLDDPGNLNVDVFGVVSQDGGETWGGNERLTDVTLPLPQLAPVNFDCRAGLCNFGDYIGLTALSSADALFIQGWGDTREAASGSGAACGGPDTSPDPDVRVLAGC